MTTTAVSVYFEESWAILSSISLANVGFGFLVAGLTSLSPISIVPIVVSVAGAIANGLCYYAFYAVHATTRTVVAAAIADVCWLIQEAGLSFYSYLILIRVLSKRDRIIFMSLFWIMIVIISALRIMILISRSKQIIAGTTHLQWLIDHLHVGYFSSLAIVECISAYFLLRKFASAKRASVQIDARSGLFRYLIRSTEIRLAGLALIGISRAVTYSFQTEAQSATSVAGQIDRFLVTLENLFPVIMFIDILASRLQAVVSNHSHESNSQRAYTKSNGGQQPNSGTGRDITMYSMNHIETQVKSQGQFSSSRERIVDGNSTIRESAGSVELERKNGGINKTVEFQFQESVL